MKRGKLVGHHHSSTMWFEGGLLTHLESKTSLRNANELAKSVQLVSLEHTSNADGESYKEFRDTTRFEYVKSNDWCLAVYPDRLRNSE